MLVQSVNRSDKGQNSRKSSELTLSDILISSIVRFKVYSPIKPPQKILLKNYVQKIGLLAGKYGKDVFMNFRSQHAKPQEIKHQSKVRSAAKKNCY